MIKDLGDGTGTYIKVLKKCELKDNSVVSFGDNHLSITFNCQSDSNSEEVNNDTIDLNFIEGTKMGES